VSQELLDDVLMRRTFGKDWEFFNLATRLQTPETNSNFTNTVEPDDQEPPLVNDDRKLEYLEMRFDAVAVFEDILTAPDVPEGREDVYRLSSNHLQVKINDTDGIDKLRQWDDWLLGIGSAMDPFSPVRHVNWEELGPNNWRWIPSCMPIWFGQANQHTEEENYTNSGVQPWWNPEAFQITIFPITGAVGDNTVWKINNAKVREIMEDFVNIHARFPSDAFLLNIWNDMDIREYPEWTDQEDERKPGEDWNPNNITQAGFPIYNRGIFKKLSSLARTAADGKPGATENIHIKFDSKMVWEPFDTSDQTNYKITTESDYGADDAFADFKIGQGTPIKFYLKPQWLGWFRDAFYYYHQPFYMESYRAQMVIPPGEPNEGQLTPYHNVQESFQYDVFYVGIPIATFDFDFKPGYTPGFNNDYPVWNTMASFSVDMSGTATDGQYSVSGLPLGQAFSGTGSYTDLGGGNYQYQAIHEDTNWKLTLTWKYIGQDFANRTKTVNNINLKETWIAGGGVFTSGMIRLFRGAHVGIWPFIPRSLAQNWRSVIGNNGSTTFTREYDGGAYADPLGEKEYNREAAKNFAGRVHTFGIGGTFADTVHPIYTRHSLRDEKDILWENLPAPYSVPSEVGQDRVFYSGSPFTLTWKEIHDADTADTVWNPMFAAVATAVSAEFNALPHIRSHGVTGSPTVLYTSDLINSFPIFHTPYIRCVPLDGYVGSLCAVLDTPDQRYFIWRRTAQDRGGFDYDRNQAHTQVQNIAMP
jgi:hypothetical protein